MKPILKIALFGVPAVSSALASLLMLPLTTRVIGAREYGEFALLSIVVIALNSIASAFMGFEVPENYNQSDKEERKKIAGTCLVLVTSVTVFGVFSILLLEFLYLNRELQLLGDLNNYFLNLNIMLVSVLLSTISIVYLEILIVTGNAGQFAFINIARTVTVVISTLVALFYFRVPQHALCLGYLSGNFTAAILSFLLSKNLITYEIDFQRMKSCTSKTRSILISNISDQSYAIFEKIYIGGLLSVTAVGILGHAQLYKNAMMLIINSVSRAVFASSLNGAKKTPPDLEGPRIFWKFIQFTTFTLLTSFVFFGEDVISFLSNDKFLDSYYVGKYLILILLIQTVGWSSAVMNLSNGKGEQNVRGQLLSNAAAFIILYISLPIYGLPAVIIAYLAQIILSRTYSIVAAKLIFNYLPKESFACTLIIVAALVVFTDDTLQINTHVQLFILGFLGLILVTYLYKIITNTNLKL